MRLIGYGDVIINGGTFRSGICFGGSSAKVTGGTFKID